MSLSFSSLRTVQVAFAGELKLHVASASNRASVYHKGRVSKPKLAMMRAYTARQDFCKHVFLRQ